MRGFFDLAEVKSQSYKGSQGMLTCVSCGLYQNVNSPKMNPYGKFGKKIMVIGEAPGKEEDSSGRLWVGESGKLLRKKYKKLGVDIYKDCLSLNAVNCFVNKTPTNHQIECCRQKIISSIKRYKPKVIILHGSSALTSLIGMRWSRSLGGINKWRGFNIPDYEFNAWVCPTFHPSFVLRQEKENEVGVLWERDLKKAFYHGEISLPSPVSEKDVIINYESQTLLEGILELEPEFLAFDIETTGLVPYDTQHHKIITISFCYDGKKSYAIPFPNSWKGIQLLKQIMENPNIKKLAANMKFEDTWLKVQHNITVKSWFFDTLIGTHILDNRQGINGLEFQAYINFGIAGYSDEISSYLKSGEYLEKNNIEELTKSQYMYNKLLTYNGLDSLLTYKLAMKQMAILEII